MKTIKWERNSRALNLAAQGKIKDEDIIPRTTTDDFPADAATVRMARMQEKVPFITLHIRGKSKQRTYSWNNTAGSGKQTYECAETCRVNFGGGHNEMMCSNGNLDEDYSWQDVHDMVEEVKNVMGIKKCLTQP